MVGKQQPLFWHQGKHAFKCKWGNTSSDTIYVQEAVTQGRFMEHLPELVTYMQLILIYETDWYIGIHCIEHGDL